MVVSLVLLLALIANELAASDSRGIER